MKRKLPGSTTGQILDRLHDGKTLYLAAGMRGKAGGFFFGRSPAACRGVLRFSIANDGGNLIT